MEKLEFAKALGEKIIKSQHDYFETTKSEECLDDLSNVITWIFFGPSGQWSEEQIIRYTENWYGKNVYGLSMEEIAFHREFSYVHHPELINLTPLNSVFKVIEVTIPKEYVSLEKAIEITNDLNRDPEYNRIFNGTAKQIYKLITGRSCPKLLKVM